MSRIDAIYRRLLLTKFFTKGWGKPDDILRIIALRHSITNHQQCSQLVSSDYPVHVDKEEIQDDHLIVEGHFTSPFHNVLPGIMPAEVQTAKFQGIFPLKWSGDLKPVVVQLAGTGDHFFWRRRSLLALPLVRRHSIGSILLENPFYGFRKPKSQLRSSLHNVADLFVMGGALILESAALFHWCERNGFGPLAITGISMGGYMASLAAANWYKPVSLIPCLSWTTASGVFTEGVLSRAIPWSLLRKQYISDQTYKMDIWPRIKSPETDLMNIVLAYQQSKSNDDVITSSVKTSSRRNTSLLSKNSKLDAEVNVFMRTLLDEFTHLGNFPHPVDTNLVIVLTAMKDAYVPIHGYLPLDELWPGIETRYLNNGHISSFLFRQKSFIEAIHDSVMKQIHKYHPESSEAVTGLKGTATGRKQRWLPRKLTNTRLFGDL